MRTVWDNPASAGGPPVPRTCAGSWARGGATRSVVWSREGTSRVDVAADGVSKVVACVLIPCVRGISSFSLPNSSARSVVPFLDVFRTI